MDADVRSFELLEALAVDGTLTAAARRLHVSQPALSQRLGGLEAQLGVRLFDRAGRRLVLTRAGRRLTQAATVVLAELRAAERDLDDLRRGPARVLRLASQCSTNYQWLAPVVQGYAARCPGVEVRVEALPDDDPIGALLADRIDVGLVVKPDHRTAAVALDALFEDEMVAVVPVGHGWASRPHVEAADFAGVHVIVFDSYDPARLPALPLPLPAGASPARVSTAPAVSELVVELVVAGQGVAILPGWVASPYATSGRVATVGLTASPERRTWSCATRRAESAPHVAAFVAALRAHVAGAATAGGL